MSFSNQSKNRVALFGTVRVMALSAVLAAMSIVCGKYLAFGVGQVLRFSFENLPILLAGMLFGPLIGAAVGVAADLIGCVLVGYAINPILTVGAAIIGATGGLLYRRLVRLPEHGRILLSVSAAHLLGSVVIKTVGLAAFYDMPVGILMLWRLLNYLIVGAMEYTLIYFILKNKAIRSVMFRR